MYIRFHRLAVSVLSLSMLLTGLCLGQTTERVSMNSLGAQGNGWSNVPSISADGRCVAFESLATDLVPGDTNSMGDIFVHDRQSGVTERVSVDSLGSQGNDRSNHPSISADGRYVAFSSDASNLVPGDTNGAMDIFVHDRQTGVTERVNVNSSGTQGHGWGSDSSSISADGRYVAFDSLERNLVPGDTNGTQDIFVHDRQTAVTKRVSVKSNGTQAGGWNVSPSISADGRFVTFDSWANDLVPGDTNFAEDVFVHDRVTGVTERVSVKSSGAQGNADSYGPSISADGRNVAFISWASNLVTGDTNGWTDVFVHDRQTGRTKRVSVDSLGIQGNNYVNWTSISSNGRHVAFDSFASNVVPGDTNGTADIFVHDRQTGVTERVSVDALGVQGNRESWNPSISTSGRYVAFGSSANNLVPDDTNLRGDVFVHDRWNGLGENSIYLTGPSTAPVLAPIQFSWQTTRGNSKYSLAVSTNRNGLVVGGHHFDLGSRMTVIASGTNTTNGTGSFTSQPVPSAAAGLTLYFEVAARDGAGVLYDSNVHAVTFY